MGNLQNHHLLWRAGFGPSITTVQKFEKHSPSKIWKHLLETSNEFIALNFDSEPVNLDYQQLAKLDAEQKRKITQLNRRQNYELNLNFLNEMVNSESQLQEKMAFFWHGHFATRVNNAKFNVQLLNEIRKNALGNFRDLLFAVSKSPAMLSFLNNQQNRKGHPNENFAREVMELFTLGRGNYTETDIRESARAFTGWAFDKQGNFLFRKNQHDEGSKNFLGKSGNFNGDDVLNIILEQKQTAKFIVTKIYRFFVNEKVNEHHISSLSNDFFASGYEIKSLLTKIFTSDWFYDNENVGNRIKSPIELMAGIMRMLAMEIENPQNLIVYQNLLGQTLFFPPNVSGWPNGTSWIDSSTLLLRMQIPQIWSGLKPLEVTPKSDDDLEMGSKNSENPLAKSFKNPNIFIDWNRAEKAYQTKNLQEILLQKQTLSDKLIQDFSGESFKLKMIDYMSTPEYQLC